MSHNSKLSEELKEIYDGMIEDGTCFYDVEKIINDARFQAEQLEAEIARLRKATEDTPHNCTCKDEVESLRAELAAVRKLCEQDREDMGVELFQKEILAVLGGQQ